MKKNSWLSFFTTLIAAVFCASLIRSFLFEPFHIPSSSMKPSLLVGDYIFTSKYSYGYSRYSFPFGAQFNYFSGRIFEKTPQRGDIIVFRLPSDPKINYVKRLIGLPGDKIQMRNGKLYINDEEVEKRYLGEFIDKENGVITKISEYRETLPNNKTFETLDQIPDSAVDYTGIYKVPQDHYFFMGDNRDNSQDSRFLEKVGYVNQENLVGKVTIIFLSSEEPIWKVWRWRNAIRFDRILQKVN